jgi:hypothetical protein
MADSYPHNLESPRPSRELAVSRRVLLLDERSMSSGGSIQAMHRSSLAVARVRPEFSALESRSARLSPNTLLVRAWRSLIELRIDDALATVAKFEVEIARADNPVAPRSREFAEVLRAVLLVLKTSPVK